MDSEVDDTSERKEKVNEDLNTSNTPEMEECKEKEGEEEKEGEKEKGKDEKGDEGKEEEDRGGDTNRRRSSRSTRGIAPIRASYEEGLRVMEEAEQKKRNKRKRKSTPTITTNNNKQDESTTPSSLNIDQGNNQNSPMKSKSKAKPKKRGKKASNKKQTTLDHFSKSKDANNDDNNDEEETEEAEAALPDTWQSTSSPHINCTVRRSIPPSFHDITSDEMCIRNVSDNITPSSSNAHHIRLSDGICTSWKPPSGRNPALYHIVHPPPKHSSSSSSGGDVSFTEDITLEELLVGLTAAKKRQNSSLSQNEILLEQQSMRYYHDALSNLQKAELIKTIHSLLPLLIVMSLQELTLEGKLSNQTVSDDDDSNGGGGSNLELEINYPKYGDVLSSYSDVYRRAANVHTVHNRSDFTSHKSSNAANSSSGSSAKVWSYQGSAIGARIRTGASLAYESLRRIHVASLEPGSNAMGVGIFESGGRICSIFLTLAILSMDSSSDTNDVDMLGLAEITKKISAKEIENATIQYLMYKEPSSRKKKTDEQLVRFEESWMVDLIQQVFGNDSGTIPYKLKCVSGEPDIDFSRAKFLLHHVPPPPPNTETDDDQVTSMLIEPPDESLEVLVPANDQQLQTTKKENRLEHQSKKYMNARIHALASGDGYSTLWPRWEDTCKAILQKIFDDYKEEDTNNTPPPPAQPEMTDSHRIDDKVSPDNNTADTQNKNNQEETDASLAKTLSESNTNTEETTLATRRTRRKNPASSTDHQSSLIFYGSATSQTQNQINDSIHRLVFQSFPGFLTFGDLYNLLVNEHETSSGTLREMRKIRNALMKLVYDQGKVKRWFCDVLHDTTLKLPLIVNGSVGLLTPVKTRNQEQPAIENGHGMDDTDGITPTPIKSESTETKPNNDDDDDDDDGYKQRFYNYVVQIHQTERSLRALILSAMQVSPRVIAAVAEDDAATELIKPNPEHSDSDSDSEEQVESTTNHPLVGKSIFRPDGSIWHITHYIPPTLSRSDVPQTTSTSSEETNLPTNRIVTKLPKFRLENDYVKDELLLSQSQVHAGLEALELKDQLKKMRACKSKSYKGRSHPMKDRIGAKLTLLLNDSNQESDSSDSDSSSSSDSESDNDEKEKDSNTLTGKVVGYNSNVDPPRLLILPNPKKPPMLHKTEENNNSNNNSMVEDITNDITNMDYEKLISIVDEEEESDTAPIEKTTQETTTKCTNTKLSTAFWVTLINNGTAVQYNSSDVDTNKTIQPQPACTKKAKILLWHNLSNPTMDICKSILNYLQTQPKAIPFREPVDPIELNLPDYFTIVKRPMDVSTLEKQLLNGKYSNIDGSVRLGDREKLPSFRKSLLLIFQNAILYNEVNSWIANDANWLMKNVIKKMDAALKKIGQPPSSSSRRKSVYVDHASDSEDSMEENEDGSYNDHDQADDDFDDDDEDDEDDYVNRRGNKSKSKSVAAADAASLNIIEMTHKLKDMLSSQTNNDKKQSMLLPFLDTNVSEFGLSTDWSAAYLNMHHNNNNSTQPKKRDTSNKTMVVKVLTQLMQTHSNSMLSQRRSTRQQTRPSRSSKDRKEDSSNDENGIVEYSLTDNPTVCGINRTQVELIQETMHEYYANVYDEEEYSMKSLEEQTSQTDNNDLKHVPSDGKDAGSIDPKTVFYTFANGVFPPYLGHICPTTNKWEIRSQLILPALKWIINGLLKSGHLKGDIVEESTSFSHINSGTNSGVIVANAYYGYTKIKPFDMLETVKKLRREQQEESESSEEEKELSEYEKARAERVRRNQERLKALGLG